MRAITAAISPRRKATKRGVDTSASSSACASPPRGDPPSGQLVPDAQHAAPVPHAGPPHAGAAGVGAGVTIPPTHALPPPHVACTTAPDFQDPYLARFYQHLRRSSLWGYRQGAKEMLELALPQFFGASQHVTAHATGAITSAQQGAVESQEAASRQLSQVGEALERIGPQLEEVGPQLVAAVEAAGGEAQAASRAVALQARKTSAAGAAAAHAASKATLDTLGPEVAAGLDQLTRQVCHVVGEELRTRGSEASE